MARYIRLTARSGRRADLPSPCGLPITAAQCAALIPPYECRHTVATILLSIVAGFIILLPACICRLKRRPMSLCRSPHKSLHIDRRRFVGGFGLARLRSLQCLPSSSERWRRRDAGAPIRSPRRCLGRAAADGFVLWTRLAPDPLSADPATPGGMTGGDVPVTYEIATDPAMRDIVRRGSRDGRDRPTPIRCMPTSVASSPAVPTGTASSAATPQARSAAP